MNENLGRTVKLFLIDGVPNGLLTCEIMNWTGHVITGPRSRLGALVQRPETSKSGVYFLVGTEQASGVGIQVYIGETEDAAKRLAAHNRPEDKGGKDFWERVCFVTSKDANLTKGHVKYLESRLIALALQAQRCELLNSTEPIYSGLPEADLSDMEYFLTQIQTLLPVLGYDFLRPAPQLQKATPPAGLDTQDLAEVSPVFVGDVPRHGITASAQEINDEFIVLKGSKSRLSWEGVPGGYQALFENLVELGVLVVSPCGKLREFARDYSFSSPSAAAAVVAGRSANGRTHWTVPELGVTYGDWQERLVSDALGRLAARAGAQDESA